MTASTNVSLYTVRTVAWVYGLELWIKSDDHEGVTQTHADEVAHMTPEAMVRDYLRSLERADADTAELVFIDHDAHVDTMLAELRRLWLAEPNKTFGQLLTGALSLRHNELAALTDPSVLDAIATAADDHTLPFHDDPTGEDAYEPPPASSDIQCTKCGNPIYLSNPESAARYGECWHTLDEDDPLTAICSAPADASDDDDKYEHRPTPAH